MINRRQNQNTRKGRIYRFNQHRYQENRKATVNKILDSTFSLVNKSEVTPKIEDVEEVYVKCLEEGNRLEDCSLPNTDMVE